MKSAHKKTAPKTYERMISIYNSNPTSIISFEKDFAIADRGGIEIIPRNVSFFASIVKNGDIIIPFASFAFVMTSEEAELRGAEISCDDADEASATVDTRDSEQGAPSSLSEQPQDLSQDSSFKCNEVDDDRYVIIREEALSRMKHRSHDTL